MNDETCNVMNADTPMTVAVKERPILFSGAMVRAILEGRKTQTRRVVADHAQFAPDAESRGRFPASNAYGVMMGDDQGAAAFLTAGDHGYTDFIPCPYGKRGERLWVRETWSHTGSGVWTIAAARSGALDGKVIYQATDKEPCPGCWWPSIHMPREFSRITLEVVKGRVERLQEILEEDAKAEGCIAETKKPYDYWDGWDYRLGQRSHSQVAKENWPEPPPWMTDVITVEGWTGFNMSAREGYRLLWNSINLEPSPKLVGKKVVSYQAFPWSAEDFEAVYPGVRASGVYRGKPITVTPNPWVWVVEFKRV
jgi:hypothetical protein